MADDDIALTPVSHDPFDTPEGKGDVSRLLAYANRIGAQDAAAPMDLGQATGIGPYTPTLSQRIGQGAQAGLEALGASRGYAQGFGDRLQDVAGLVPGVGQAIAGYDAGRAGAAGNYGGAALAALGAIPMAGGAVAREAEESAPRIIAYHGSPHSFDKFDLSKIGTGEGAQAYGHGLYFADNENVAKAYRDQLAGMQNGNARRALAAANGDHDAAIAKVNDAIAGLNALPDKGGDERRWAAQMQIQKDKLSALNDMKAGKYNPDGSMYQVAINANPDHFLDWDKPLSEQHPHIHDALSDVYPQPDTRDVGYNPNLGAHLADLRVRGQSIGTFDKADLPTDPSELKRFAMRNDPLTGGAIYESSRLVPGDFRDPVAAAEALKARGIPGIKYLDAGSRDNGDGSRNYVVFNDKTIDILKKYGLAGLMGTAGLSAGAHVALTPVDGDPFAQASQ